ncbi:GNAT family N-acetyltransferase [Paenibacillus hexagrammi]|uniref:GNAT family N-acetyltransferase n=1 Tax=Paenibacillus hexagrammi TaxID=2908839 RepID=A0ABY3STC1_9BACL|nr:GNAT family N-acetyltransferase [Paenibacillus sp. YPD9-1]UJF36340.1 GNAT family N-acetyltransferase [Paenibacillus sp. YPD9-1]
MFIRELALEEEWPIDVLLLADPDEAMIRSYRYRGSCYVAEVDKQIVGAYVLLPTRPKTAEIICIAVEESHQGRGIGRALICHAVQTAKDSGYVHLDVGTGNSSISQLALYQKCGFRIVGVERDHFVKHYMEPIMEDGLPCLDMIRLQLELG